MLLATGERTIDLGKGIIGFVGTFTPGAIALLERKVRSEPFVGIGTICPGSDVDMLSCVLFPRIVRSGSLSLWSTSSHPHTLIHDQLQCNTPGLQQGPTSKLGRCQNLEPRLGRDDFNSSCEELLSSHASY